MLLVSPVAQRETQETQGQSLEPKDPLEKEMATHSMEIPWTEQPGGLQSKGSQRVEYDWAHKYTYPLCTYCLLSLFECSSLAEKIKKIKPCLLFGEVQASSGEIKIILVFMGRQCWRIPFYLGLWIINGYHFDFKKISRSGIIKP